MTISVGRPKIEIHPSVRYLYVIPVWQSFFLGNIEKELHEASDQWRAQVVDILSNADAVAVLRPEEDVSELLGMSNAELHQAASYRKKTLFPYKMFSGNGVLWQDKWHKREHSHRVELLPESWLTLPRPNWDGGATHLPR